MHSLLCQDQYTGLVELEFETPIGTDIFFTVLPKMKGLQEIKISKIWRVSMLCPENPLGGTSIVNAERQHRIKANGTDLVKKPLVIRHK